MHDMRIWNRVLIPVYFQLSGQDLIFYHSNYHIFIIVTVSQIMITPVGFLLQIDMRLHVTCHVLSSEMPQILCII